MCNDYEQESLKYLAEEQRKVEAWRKANLPRRQRRAAAREARRVQNQRHQNMKAHGPK